MRMQIPRPWVATVSAAVSAVLALTIVLAPTPAAAERPSASAGTIQAAGMPDLTTVRAPLAVSDFERFYNPFGDPWASRTAPNPSIPVALTPACSRYGPKQGLSTPNPEEIQFLATTSSPLLFEECSFLIDADDGIGDLRQRTFISAVKAARPDARYLAFFEPAIGHLSHRNSPPPYHVGVEDIDTPAHEDWFVHRDGQPISPATRVKHLADAPGLPSQSFLFDIRNPDFRAFMIQKAIASMNLHGIDGVVIEQCGDFPSYDRSDPSNAPSAAYLDAFDDACVDFLRELKQAAPGKLVFFLGYASLRGQVENRPEAERETLSYSFYTRRADVSDGLFWEDPLGGATNIGVNPPDEVFRKLDRFRVVQNYAASRDNYIGVVVNTNAQGQSTFANTSVEQQHAFAQYYLAAYLALFRGEKSPLIYYTPSSIGEQFRSATSFSIWNVNVGTPSGPPATALGTNDPRYQRDFSRARVFLNGGNNPWPVSLSDRAFTTLDGQPVTSAVIPPRSGAIFLGFDIAAECASRPKVQVTTTPGGNGTLQVKVKAGLGTIQSIRFGQARSAVVDVPNGPTGSAGGFTFTPPAGSNLTELTFTVRRTAPGGVHVPFFAADLCGEWQTFVGGGPNAF